jgi:hypothetical protein
MTTHHSLITPEDHVRIDRLEAERPEDQELHWLCRLARKLAALKPIDGEFPEYLALINPSACNGMAIRFAERVHLVERELTWIGPAGTGKVILLEEALSCNVTDAFLFVRPYVRLLSPESAGTREQLERLGKVTVRADDTVLFNGSISEVLVGPDGYGVHRKPFSFRYHADPKGSVFGTGVLNAEGEATPSDHGVFLTHRTKVLIELEYPLRDGELKLATGLVMARYTTMDSKYGSAFRTVNK